jgi:hypothetical protein
MYGTFANSCSEELFIESTWRHDAMAFATLHFEEIFQTIAWSSNFCRRANEQNHMQTWIYQVCPNLTRVGTASQPRKLQPTLAAPTLTRFTACDTIRCGTIN